ncbi:hypothetical protein BOX15_Mlig028853g1, partial [Macrostomum lignano]
AMTLAYVKNTIGLTVSDEELENIPHPSLELYTHTTYRGVQFGIFVSMAMVAPVVTAIRGPRNFSGLAARALRFGRVGALAGLPLGPAMTIGMTRGDPDVAMYDRAYRLRYNFNQVRQDRFGIASTAAGAAVGGINGALCGVLAGILLGTIYNTAMAPAHQKAPKYEKVKALVKEAKELAKQATQSKAE